MSEKLDLSQMRKIAEGATQDYWWSIGLNDKNLTGPIDKWCVDSGPVLICSIGSGEEYAKKNAEHISTFDPPNALELIDRCEKAEEEVAHLRQQMKHRERIEMYLLKALEDSE